MAHDTIVDDKDVLITAGMLADRLRPLVLASCDQGETGTSCLNGGPFIPLHRATVGAIYQHLERIAGWDGEKTILALEMELRGLDHRHAQGVAETEELLAQRRKGAAQGIETAEPPRRETGLARKGESPVVATSDDAPNPSGESQQ